MDFYLLLKQDCERRAIAKLFHHRTNETTDPPPANLRLDMIRHSYKAETAIWGNNSNATSIYCAFIQLLHSGYMLSFSLLHLIMRTVSKSDIVLPEQSHADSQQKCLTCLFVEKRNEVTFAQPLAVDMYKCQWSHFLRNLILISALYCKNVHWTNQSVKWW